MTTFEFLDKYNSKYGSTPVKEDLKNFCRDLKSAKLGMIDNLLSTLEDRGLQQFEIEEIKKDAEILSRTVKTADEIAKDEGADITCSVTSKVPIKSSLVKVEDPVLIKNMNAIGPKVRAVYIVKSPLRGHGDTGDSDRVTLQYYEEGYQSANTTTVPKNWFSDPSDPYKFAVKSSIQRTKINSIALYGIDQNNRWIKVGEASLLPDGKYKILSLEDYGYDFKAGDIVTKDKLLTNVEIKSSIKSLTQAVRPTTVAIEKAVKGEIGDDEAAIRFFLKDKVTPASLDKAVALVLKYIPIIRKQQKKQNFATAGQIATKTDARVLPVGGDILPSKRSLSGVTYKGWTIDAAQKTPGTYYALFVGVNGPYVKAGFTDPKAALDWVEEVGDPSVYQGYVDTENIGKDIQTSVDSVSFKNLSDDEKREIIDDFLAFGKVSPETLSSLSSDQRDTLQGITNEKDLKKALNQRFGALNKQTGLFDYVSMRREAVEEWLTSVPNPSKYEVKEMKELTQGVVSPISKFCPLTFEEVSDRAELSRCLSNTYNASLSVMPTEEKVTGKIIVTKGNILLLNSQIVGTYYLSKDERNKRYSLSLQFILNGKQIRENFSNDGKE